MDWDDGVSLCLDDLRETLISFRDFGTSREGVKWRRETYIRNRLRLRNSNSSRARRLHLRSSNCNSLRKCRGTICTTRDSGTRGSIRGDGCAGCGVVGDGHVARDCVGDVAGYVGAAGALCGDGG